MKPKAGVPNGNGGASFQGLSQFLILGGVLGALEQNVDHFEVDVVGI